MVAFPKEQQNLSRLYTALLNEQEVPPLESFGSFGDLADVASILYNARKDKGAIGVLSVIKAYNNRKRMSAAEKKALEAIAGAPNATTTQSKPVGVLLSDVKPEKIQWIWKDRLARGKITTIDGDPGLGKSLLEYNLAARISRGLEMPDGSPGVKGGVVLITPEDGLADTVQPRLARAGADLTKIVSISTIETVDPNTGYTYNRPFQLPDDLYILESAIERVNACLVIIDPVMAILGGKDTYKDNEVRSILSPVQMLVEKAGAACIVTRHLTKHRGDNPLYSGGGSMAFIAMARTGFMVMRDPIDDSRCVFAHVKTNIGKLSPNLTYTIASDEEEGDERPYVVWEGVSTHSIQDLMVPPSKPGAGRQDILRVLNEHAPDALSPQDILDELPDMTINNIRVTLKRMYEDGQIEKSARGAYCAKSK